MNELSADILELLPDGWTTPMITAASPIPRVLERDEAAVAEDSGQSSDEEEGSASSSSGEEQEPEHILRPDGHPWMHNVASGFVHAAIKAGDQWIAACGVQPQGCVLMAVAPRGTKVCKHRACKARLS